MSWLCSRQILIDNFLNLENSKSEPSYYRLSIVHMAIFVWIDRAQHYVLCTISALLRVGAHPAFF